MLEHGGDSHQVTRNKSGKPVIFLMRPRTISNVFYYYYVPCITLLGISVFEPEPNQCTSATLCEEKNRKLNLQKLLLPIGL